MRPPHLSLSIAALALCCAAAAPALSRHHGASTTARGLTPHQRAALAVSRFTFGARPGEVAAVEREGVDQWLERQLHPASIDDSALEHRLDQYPALRMSAEARAERYPAPATLRRIANTGAPLPADPELHAILADQVEFYERGRAAKQAAAATMGSPASTASTAPVPLPPLEQTVEPMDAAEAQAITQLPPNQRYARLLSLSAPDLIALRKRLRAGKGGERQLADGMTPLQAETLRALAGTNRMLAPEVEGSRLLRDIYSGRELEAVMTDFWLNHFNVYERKNGEELSLLPAWEQTVRAHALGRFEDLLVATAESPAMLVYLDNAQSTGPDSPAAQRAARNPKNRKPDGLNENYARELMELHTLGVDGGYTQHDVTEVAKVLTGWTVERPGEGGGFTFNANRHQPGTKLVLGHTIAEGGQAEGLAVLHLLATSPATAHFLSLELAQRFVSDTPPPALVDRMAATYLKTDGSVAEVLRTLFHSPELWSPATVHAKFKTPLEYVVSAVRASGAEVADPQPLQAELQRLGQPVYGCQTPNGYKGDEASWLSSGALVARLNFALDLGANRAGGGITVDWPRELGLGAPAFPGQSTSPSRNDTTPTPQSLAASAAFSPAAALPDPAQAEQALEALLLDSPAGASTRTAVLSALSNPQPVSLQTVSLPRASSGSAAAAGPDQINTLAGLLLGSPEFQRR